MISRRLLLVLPLAACGYRGDVPAERVTGRGPVVSLAVAARDQRKAQLLRDYLDREIASAGLGERIEGVALRIDIITQELGIRNDETPSRARLLATVRYVASRRVASGARPSNLYGTVRLTEGYNYIEGEYFATDSSRDAAEQRLMREAAEQIARRLSAATLSVAPQPARRGA